MKSGQRIRAGLVGVTGYTGMELARILATHPNIDLVCATSRKEAGSRLVELYPFLQGFAAGDVVIAEADPRELAAACDVVFLAIPHGAAMNLGAELLAYHCKVIDLSADYRIRDKAVYEEWYKVPHTQESALTQAVYGLPELYADTIRPASLIANPGCYPTATILGLYPALQKGLIEAEGIVIDAKSGATGAGRNPQQKMLFCEVADSFRAYSLASHRHTPEIEQELGRVAGTTMRVSFNPHLLPINRGILATIYTTLKQKISLSDIHGLYVEAYGKQPFIRVSPAGTLPELRNVRGTMFCDIGFAVDHRTNRLIIVSAIDNLCRGASGQAVANANLMFDLPITAGLWTAPLVP